MLQSSLRYLLALLRHLYALRVAYILKCYYLAENGLEHLEAGIFH